jgi:hypothetical protein
MNEVPRAKRARRVSATSLHPFALLTSPVWKTTASFLYLFFVEAYLASGTDSLLSTAFFSPLF